VDEIVGKTKERLLIDGANAYMEKLEKEYECRIDLILLEKKSGNSTVIHIEDAISQTQ
jgi:Holliday junction resolvase-like predicted endonuclease